MLQTGFQGFHAHADILQVMCNMCTALFCLSFIKGKLNKSSLSLGSICCKRLFIIAGKYLKKKKACLEKQATLF